MGPVSRHYAGCGLKPSLPFLELVGAAAHRCVRQVGKPWEDLACLDDAACSIEVTQKHSTEAELCKIRGELLSIVA